MTTPFDVDLYRKLRARVRRWRNALRSLPFEVKDEWTGERRWYRREP